MIRKLLPKNHESAIAVLKHVWDQEYRDIEKRPLMDKYWKRNNELGEMFLEIGKSRARKNETKLSLIVNKLKSKYNSLRQACRLGEISWTKFHRHIYINKNKKAIKKQEYKKKLSKHDIESIQNHYTSEEVSFPMPDKKYVGKRFMRSSLNKAHKMYNLLPSTTRKISASTYYKYKPKAIKLQGKIPFRQSCCEKCQNFENTIGEISKYMRGFHRDVGDCVDASLCHYEGFFPKIDCILRTCPLCGVNNFKQKAEVLNATRMKDKRKRFMVKVWVTKTKMNEGVKQSYLHWNHERLNYEGLLDLYCKQLENMAEHTFMATWNYCQYKKAKHNLAEGEILIVDDFAQNYLCGHQNEPQGLHWLHQQVTLHPSVAMYNCKQEGCNKLVMHEVVHISDDMKHDAHIVKNFRTRTIEALQKNNIAVHKIIQFTDQAPSQYKNKTAFHYLAENTIPTQCHFFGVRHGKGPCDACTGHVKQAITRLVKNETEVVNSATTFHEAAVKHLQKPLKSDNECQHHILTFELHKKIGIRPKTTNWVPVPDTCKIHSIGNTGNKSVLYFRNFACCCDGCLHGGECTNTVCPDTWKGYDLGKKKFVQPNFTFWEQFNLCISDAQLQNDIQLTWDERLTQIRLIRNFDDLQAYVNSNPLPEFEGVTNDNMLESDKANLDFVALHHLPNDAPDGFAPISMEGDGNCFPRTVSYILQKNQAHHKEIRTRILYEAIHNMDKYLDNDYVTIGAHHFYRRATLVQTYAMYTEGFDPLVPLDVLKLYKEEVMEIRKLGGYMGIWQLFQTANILRIPIHSVYPIGCSSADTRADLNRVVYCSEDACNNENPIKIMWTPTQIKKQRPCHFVPLLKVVRNICKM